MQLLSSFFGMIIRFIYGLLNNNYFWSIIVFTIFTKVVLFPLAWIQIKSMEKINRIAPKDKFIREKYKNDKQKQTEELAKLYSENKINPLGGCLPLLIQLPIIISMFYIVRQPLTYILQVPQDQIKVYTQEILQKEDVTDKEMDAYELTVAKEKNLIDMNVGFGFNMGDIPSNVFSNDEAKKAHPVSLLVPILTVLLAIFQNKMNQKGTEMSEEQLEMQKSMNLFMPLLTGFIAYTMPLALGVYWLFGNVLQIIQQQFINFVVKKDKEKLALNEGGIK